MNFKHGKARKGAVTPEFRVWATMLSRCYSESNRKFHRYGGRGIGVCERWRDDFAAFLADMGSRPSPRHSLDRIDNDADYSPTNCRWATQRQQQNNRANNRMVVCNGRRMSFADAARELGVSVNTLYSRRRKGLSPQEAVDLGAQSYRRGREPLPRGGSLMPPPPEDDGALEAALVASLEAVR